MLLFDYASTALLRSIASSSPPLFLAQSREHVCGPGGTQDKHVLVADYHGHSVLKFTLGGVYVGDVYDVHGCCLASVVETEAGELIIVDNMVESFCILRPPDDRRDEFLSAPDESFQNVYAVASRGPFVYALDRVLEYILCMNNIVTGHFRARQPRLYTSKKVCLWLRFDMIT